MKKLIPALLLVAALAAPRFAQARAVTLTTTLKNFGGYSAYVVLYLMDPQGKYVRTLWMAGGRSGYYRHLGGWMRASRGDMNGLDGITGASVGEGRTLTVHTDIADALIDAGYTIQIDAASEGMMESPAEVRAPLTAADSGKAVHGRGYIANFAYKM